MLLRKKGNKLLPRDGQILLYNKDYIIERLYNPLYHIYGNPGLRNKYYLVKHPIVFGTSNHSLFSRLWWQSIIINNRGGFHSLQGSIEDLSLIIDDKGLIYEMPNQGSYTTHIEGRLYLKYVKPIMNDILNNINSDYTDFDVSALARGIATVSFVWKRGVLKSQRLKNQRCGGVVLWRTEI